MSRWLALLVAGLMVCSYALGLTVTGTGMGPQDITLTGAQCATLAWSWDGADLIARCPGQVQPWMKIQDAKVACPMVTVTRTPTGYLVRCR